MQKIFKKKINTVGLILVGVLLVPILAYLPRAFGWTNPSQDPPGGSGLLTALNNKIGVNTASPSTTLTVNGSISASGNTIVDVATPIASTDAANKAYVDAQAGGGGGSIVLYGVGTPSPETGVFRAPGGTVPSCLRGSISCAGAGAAPVAAGTNVPSCPTGWTQVYAGYGPMNTMFTWYANSAGVPEESAAPTTAVIGTDSICSTQHFAIVRDTSIASQGGGQVNNSVSYLSACTSNYCNTCRICVK